MQTIRRVTLGKYAYIENVLVPNHYNVIAGSGYFFVEPEKKGHVTCLFACFGNVHANMRLYPRIIQFACYLIDSDARFSFSMEFYPQLHLSCGRSTVQCIIDYLLDELH